MPFNSNTAAGTVVYTDGAYNAGQVLSADQTVNNTTTLAEVTDLRVPIAKYERLLLKYTVWYTTNASGDFKFEVDAPGTPTEFRVATTSTAVEGVTGDGALIALDTSDPAAVSIATSGTKGYVTVSALVNGGSTAGDITFKFAQNSAQSSTCIVVAGSSVEYMRF